MIKNIHKLKGMTQLCIDIYKKRERNQSTLKNICKKGKQFIRTLMKKQRPNKYKSRNTKMLPTCIDKDSGVSISEKPT